MCVGGGGGGGGLTGQLSQGLMREFSRVSCTTEKKPDILRGYTIHSPGAFFKGALLTGIFLVLNL